jgi:RNA polymerase sigma-70 factor (ECF subfamily)
VAFLKNSTASPLSDAALVQAYQQTADLAVLAMLYERYMDLVYGVCLKYLKDSENAKDSVLQIFEALILKVKHHQITNFRAWLYQLSKNHCLMQLRAGKKIKKVPASDLLMQSEVSLHLDAVLEREDQLEALQGCLAQLNKEQRQVVELFYLQGKAYKEIGPLLGIDVSTVRSHLQNGRRNLKICMDKKTNLS